MTQANTTRKNYLKDYRTLQRGIRKQRRKLDLLCDEFNAQEAEEIDRTRHTLNALMDLSRSRFPHFSVEG